MTELKAQPKGSMCMNCVHREDDCSHLPFDKMPKIGYNPDTDVPVVRCTEFVRKSDEGEA